MTCARVSVGFGAACAGGSVPARPAAVLVDAAASELAGGAATVLRAHATGRRRCRCGRGRWSNRLTSVGRRRVVDAAQTARVDIGPCLVLAEFRRNDRDRRRAGILCHRRVVRWRSAPRAGVPWPGSRTPPGPKGLRSSTCAVASRQTAHAPRRDGRAEPRRETTANCIWLLQTAVSNGASALCRRPRDEITLSPRAFVPIGISASGPRMLPPRRGAKWKMLLA